jgi:hypothetical protein
MEHSMSQLSDSIRGANEKINFWLKKSLADDFFINGEYDSSLFIYRDIVRMSAKDSVLLSNRVQRRRFMNEQENELQKKFSDLNTRLITLNKMRRQLELEKSDLVDSLSFTAFQLDSIYSLYTENVKNFQKELENIKEGLQIIEITRPDGNRVFYVGERLNGRANGQGVGVWTTGGIYKGSWKDNLRHGLGVYKWKDGEFYEGEFEFDKRSGFGKYIWKDGEYYIGYWKDNMRNGEGSMYYPNGKLQYQGSWTSDTFILPKKQQMAKDTSDREIKSVLNNGKTYKFK